MSKCKICGDETKKQREICLGCYSLKKVARNKDKSAKRDFEIASSHLEKNPRLINLSWPSFWKKNKNVIV